MVTSALLVKEEDTDDKTQKCLPPHHQSVKWIRKKLTQTTEKWLYSDNLVHLTLEQELSNFFWPQPMIRKTSTSWLSMHKHTERYSIKINIAHFSYYLSSILVFILWMFITTHHIRWRKQFSRAGSEMAPSCMAPSEAISSHTFQGLGDPPWPSTAPPHMGESAADAFTLCGLTYVPLFP